MGINQNGALIDARFTVSNTGLLRGQGTLRLDWVPRKGMPILYSRRAHPGAREPVADGLAFGLDRLARAGDVWQLDVREDNVSARLQLVPELPEEPPARWDRAGRAWSVGLPVLVGRLPGFVRSSAADDVIDGRGLLLRRRGDDPPMLRGADRLGIYLLGAGVSVGVDQTGGRALSWASVGDLVLPAGDATIVKKRRGVFELDFRPALDLTIRVKARQQKLRSHPWEHLSRPERWLLGRLVGEPVRRVQAATARTRTAGVSAEYPAIIVSVTYR